MSGLYDASAQGGGNLVVAQESSSIGCSLTRRLGQRVRRGAENSPHHASRLYSVERSSYYPLMAERWFYICTSNLTGSDAEDQVRDIVAVSLPRNRSLDVTGALLFTGVRFAQYLEGPRSAITELRASIIADTRHEDVRTIASGPYEHRRFLRWSLAYAGPSRFVAAKVEKALVHALTDGQESVNALAEMLAGFAIDGHG